MTVQARLETDMTIRSFAYVAKQLASSSALDSCTLYGQLLAEAEKYRSALRLMQRDAFEMAEQDLRKQTLTKAEFTQVRETASRTIAQAQQSITRIAAQYAPQQLAA